jgi:putative hydrolase of the HAD superfamily
MDDRIMVFDLGGTLMEYEGMPYSWVEYYEKAFEMVNADFNLHLSKEDIQKSCEILESKNARVVYREIEYTPIEIFTAVTEHWQRKTDLNAIINSFYRGYELKSLIYDDTVDCLECLKEKGVKTAALTDLPTAMPDELFKKDIADLLKYFDLYVSSLTCGFRKPSKNGLLYIAKHFNIDVGELIFVGDEEKDIKAAQNAGCVSILIDRNGNVEKDYGQNYTITSLNEIFSLFDIKKGRVNYERNKIRRYG